MLRLKNESKIISPIIRLPAEVLAKIFTIVVNSCRTFHAGTLTEDFSVNQVNAIASVCLRWRHIALDTGTLWSYINCKTLHRLEHANLWLDRARDSPLDVVAASLRSSSDPGQTFRSSFKSIIPRIRHLRSITSCSESQSAQSWVMDWCAHGAGRTLTTLAIAPPNRRGVEFPTPPSNTSQKHLDELFYSVDRLLLKGLWVRWDLINVPNLVTISLSTLSITTKNLAQIFLASPRLRYIRLHNLSMFTAPEPSLPIIRLDHLETLELSDLESQDAHLLLDALVPGKCDLELKLLDDCGWETDSLFRNAFIALCERSNVTTLCWPNQNISQNVVVSVPNLEVIIFSFIDLDLILHEIFPLLYDNTQSPPKRVQSCLPNVHTFCAHQCSVEDADILRKFLFACPVRDVRLSRDIYIADGNVIEIREIKSWINLDVNVQYMEADWAMKYAPFGV